MEKYRLFGDTPFSTVLVHGGPGAAGEMFPVAVELGKNFGVLEPFQTKYNIAEQVRELVRIIKNQATPPVNLVGYSWGAWLSWITAAEYPDLVKKLILVSSGPFDPEYVEQMNRTREERWSERDKQNLKSLMEKMKSPETKDKKEVFGEFGKIFEKSDLYEPVKVRESMLDPDPKIYNSIWPEADKLRASGELLELGKKIKCQVAVIHGDFDPHPWKGVKEPLEQVLDDFEFILLEKCGHTPWKEKFAGKQFFDYLIGIIKETDNNRD